MEYITKQSPPYDALAVSNYFLKKHKNISPMKLQKLLYFAHGWHLAIVGEPLLEQRVEAWDYGPVIPSVYREFSRYGSNSIEQPEGNYKIKDGKIIKCIPMINENDDSSISILDSIWDTYGNFSAIQLSNLTHQKGTPWEQIKSQTGLSDRNTVIPDDMIKDYFVGKMKHV